MIFTFIKFTYCGKGFLCDFSTGDFTHLNKHFHFIMKLCLSYKSTDCRHNLNPTFLSIKHSFLCMYFDILISSNIIVKLFQSLVLLQYCHCVSHSANIHSCFSFQISAFYCIRSLWYSISQQR